MVVARQGDGQTLPVAAGAGDGVPALAAQDAGLLGPLDQSEVSISGQCPPISAHLDHGSVRDVVIHELSPLHQHQRVLLVLPRLGADGGRGHGARGGQTLRPRGLHAVLVLRKGDN